MIKNKEDMMMNLYLCLYNQIKLSNSYNLVQSVIKLCLDDEACVSKFNGLVPYQLMYDQDTYCTKLLDIYYKNKDYGCEILEIITDYVGKTDKQHDMNIQQFKLFLSSDLEEIMEDNMIISKAEYTKLHSEKKDYKKIKRQLISKQQVYSDFQKDLTRLMEKIEVLEKEKQILLQQVKDFEEKQICLEGLIKLSNKKVLCFIESKKAHDTQDLIQQYNLKSLRIESSLKSPPNIDEIIRQNDLIVFSTSCSKHSVFNKVKNQENLIIVSNTNLEKIFNEIIVKLGRG